MDFKNVLVLGAHPDDEMGAAGLITRRKAAGAHVEIATFSRCEDLNSSILIDEWWGALDSLGIDGSELFSYPNRRLPEHRHEILKVLDRFKSLRRWDLILCPSTLDAHQDHATVAQEARRAFKNTTILGYELPFNHVGQSNLNAYVVLTDEEMNKKLEHAAFFKTQAHKPYMQPEYIQSLAKLRGVQCGTANAEAYEVIRWVL